MKQAIIIIIFTATAFILGYLSNEYLFNKEEVSILSPVTTTTPKPLEAYTIENLSNSEVKEGKITIVEEIEENDNFTSSLFSFTFNPNPAEDYTKKATGMINIPNEEGKYPLILMIRGYVDQSIYETGMGTKNASYLYSDNEFITIAPDFLGYAGSDIEAENIFETRFQTYVAVLSLLNSIDQIEKWDKQNIFIWGHSNGGQIAIIVHEILEDAVPTTLWAPVTKPFPYSILYYTDESPDKGKYIRAELSNFEDLYDVENYSLDNYLDKINAPLQVHQGTADDAVPISWTNQFVNKMEDLEKDIIYFTYPGADHNLRPDWDQVTSRDLEYFESFLD